MTDKLQAFIDRLDLKTNQYEQSLVDDAVMIHDLLTISETIVQSFDDDPCFEHIVQVFDRLCELQLWSIENESPCPLTPETSLPTTGST